MLRRQGSFRLYGGEGLRVMRPRRCPQRRTHACAVTCATCEQKRRNAYMLVYERRVAQEPDPDTPEEIEAAAKEEEARKRAAARAADAAALLRVAREAGGPEEGTKGKGGAAGAGAEQEAAPVPVDDPLVTCGAQVRLS